MSQTRTQILHSIQQAIDSDWHNWQKLSYIRSQIQGLLDQETRPNGNPPVTIVNLTIVNIAAPPTGQEPTLLVPQPRM
jgi:hypothetical protein